jgi:S1-C subfamily serine protease
VTAIDLIILVFAAFFALVGFARGFVIGVLSLAGFALGAYLGTRFGPQLLTDGNASPFAPLFGLLGALIGGTLLSAGAEGIAGAMRATMVNPALRTVDGVLGAVLAIALALAIAWLLSVIVLQTPGIRDYRRTIQRSAILRELNEILPSDKVLKALARFDPFPRITGPHADVPPPKGSVARDPDIQNAAGSVVQILGNSCGLGVSGSGWVVKPGVVVTNAHVVAGQERGDTVVRLRDRGLRYDATAIAFDSRNDVAVLRVPGLPAPPLPYSREVRVGEPGAAVGYPLSGPERERATRIGATEVVLTQDAYGQRLVRRRITSFRGNVQPGNSGGPIIDVAGRVAATVFAKSTSGGPSGGFAIPNSVVRKVLGRASGAVGTGGCTR